MAKQPKSKRRTGAKAQPKPKAPRAGAAAPKITLERVKDVVGHYRPLLMGVPGVQSVTVGLKQTKGRYAHQLGQPDVYCVVIYVGEKWPAAKTKQARSKQAASEGAIPATLDGVPTDVRTLPTGTATLSGGATVRPELSDGNPGGRGTITIVCQDSKGRSGFVTAAHVACPEIANKHPINFAANTGDLQPVGKVGPSSPLVGISRYDYAFVVADKGVALTVCEVIDTSGDQVGKTFAIDPALGPGNGYELDVGSDVFLVGRKSGVRHGRVDVAVLPAPVPFNGFDAVELMQIASHDHAQFCDGGDSGGPILMQLPNNQIALVGMVLGFDQKGNGLAHWWGEDDTVTGVATAMKVSL